MVTWFLRLFRACRDLESQVTAAGERLIQAQDVARRDSAVISELRTQLNESREELIEVLKNRPTPAQPAGSQEVIRSRRILGRDVVAQKTAEFFLDEAARASVTETIKFS